MSEIATPSEPTSDVVHRLNSIATVTPGQLHYEALDGAELAIVDVREKEAYVSGHISIAVELPLSELELRISSLLPRKTIRVVITDEDEGTFATTAAQRLLDIGYSDVRILKGGLAAWSDAGFELITGEYSLSKALGEFVERHYHTPKITATDLQAKIAAGEELVILDTRTIEEYEHIALPGGIAAPGAELLYRAFDNVPSPNTPVVVNCAGRTRAIIGAQALRNAGFPNPVVSLENGTGAWLLAGLEPVSGASAHANRPSADGLEKARTAGEKVAARFSVPTLDADGLAAFYKDAAKHTLYVFDVRTAEEFEHGHIPRAVSAPGGQLVQTTDKFIASRHARVVLVDEEDLVRSRITASWLIQLGLTHVYVYPSREEERSEAGSGAPTAPNSSTSVKTISAADLQQLLAAGEATVLDLDPPPPYYRERKYIAGSLAARRATLPSTVANLANANLVVLTSGDGAVAHLAAADLSDNHQHTFVALEGGTLGWINAGFPFETGLNQAALDESEALPQLPTLDERRTRLAAYVHWGDVVTEQLERDGLVKFRTAVA